MLVNSGNQWEYRNSSVRDSEDSFNFAGVSPNLHHNHHGQWPFISQNLWVSLHSSIVVKRERRTKIMIEQFRALNQAHANAGHSLWPVTSLPATKRRNRHSLVQLQRHSFLPFSIIRAWKNKSYQIGRSLNNQCKIIDSVDVSLTFITRVSKKFCCTVTSGKILPRQARTRSGWLGNTWKTDEFFYVLARSWKATIAMQANNFVLKNKTKHNLRVHLK